MCYLGQPQKEFIELYFSLPLEGKLALVRTKRIEHCLLAVVTKCVEEKDPNDFWYEIDQVLAEYVSHENFKEDISRWYSYDSFSETQKRRNYLFSIIEALPNEFFHDGFGEVFCKEVLIHPDEYNHDNEEFENRFKALPLDAQLKLLKRKDIKLQAYRKSIILKKHKDFDIEYSLKYSALYGIHFTPKLLGEYLNFQQKWRASLSWDKADIVTDGESYIMKLDHYPLWVYAAIWKNDNSSPHYFQIHFKEMLEKYLENSKMLRRREMVDQYKWLLFYLFVEEISYADEFLSGSLEWLKKYVVRRDKFQTMENLINPLMYSDEFKNFFAKNFSKYDFDAIFDVKDMWQNKLYLEVFKDFKNYDEDKEIEKEEKKFSKLRIWFLEKLTKYYIAILILYCFYGLFIKR